MTRYFSLFLFFSFLNFNAHAFSPKIDTLRFEGIPSTIVNDVHVITGDYCERLIDIKVHGALPLTFARTYCSGLAFGGGSIDTGTLHGFWSHNHYGAIYLQGGRMADKFFTHKGGKIHTYNAFAFDSNASSTFFESDQSDAMNPMDFQLRYGISNNAYCNQDHPNWKSQHLKIDGKLCSLLDGKGGKKTYEKRGQIRYLLKEDKQSSGNTVRYEYRESTDLLPTRIASYDSKGKEELNWIDLNFRSLKGEARGGSWGVDIKTSQGRTAKLSFSRVKGVLNMFTLNRVESSDQPTVEYEYGKKGRITKRKLPHGRHRGIAYYPFKGVGGGYYRTSEYVMPVESGKVRNLWGPVGKGEELLLTDTFTYFCDHQGANEGYRGHTDHVDAIGNKTQYFFSSDHKITRIVKYTAGGNHLLTEKYYWGEAGSFDDSNLLCKTIEDAAGNIYAAASYVYDERGNLLEHSVWGDITGRIEGKIQIENGRPVPGSSECRSTRYQYSGENQMIQKLEEGGRETQYSYYAGTDLLKSEFLLFDGKIKRRCFYKYDASGILIESIEDDGSERAIDDFTSITHRKIKRCVPSFELPSMGLPKREESLYLDLESKEEVLLEAIEYSYDEMGREILTDHFDADSVLRYSLRKGYDEKSRVTLEVDSRGKTYRYRYDANGNKIYSRGPDENLETFYHYDFSNRLIQEKQQDSNGEMRIRYFEYDFMGNKVASTDPFGERTVYEYDMLGRMTKVIHPAVLDHDGKLYHPATIYAYDRLGNRILEKNAKGEETKTRYTIFGKPLRVEYPDGTVESFEYSLEGELLKKVTKTGAVEKYTRDYLGRVVEALVLDGSGEVLKQSSKDYGTFHLLRSVDSEENVEERTYDFAGRLKTLSRGASLTSYSYDAMGNTVLSLKKVSQDGPVQRKHEEFDLLGRKVSQQILDGEEVLRESYFSYDKKDRLVKETRLTDQGESVTERRYNAFGEQILRSDALGSAWETTYNLTYKNELGQNVLEKTEIDPNGRRIRYIHDTLRRVSRIEIVSPEEELLDAREIFYDRTGNKSKEVHSVYYGKDLSNEITTLWSYAPGKRLLSLSEAIGSQDERVTKYSYASDGQLEKITLPTAVELYHHHDVLGRLLKMSSSDGTVDYTYSYNGNDQVIAVSDAILGKEERYAYDSRGDLASEYFLNGLELNYERDFLGRVTALSLPGGARVEYGYNAMDLLWARRLDEEGKERYRYEYEGHDLSGNPRRDLLPGPLGYLVKDYDILGRLVGASHLKHSWEVTSFDPVGNLLSQELNGARGKVEEEYSYDGMYQLVHEKGLGEHHYVYDSLYNCLEKDGKEREHNSLNALLYDGKYSYEYDASGNLLSKVSDEARVKYRYDALNRLISVEVEGKPVATFIYDSKGRRVQKQMWDAEVLVSDQRFVYFGESECGAYDAEEVLEELRLLGPGRGEAFRSSLALELFGNLYVPLRDVRGSVVALLDGVSGGLVESYAYSGFGEEAIYGGDGELLLESAVGNVWRYSDKRVDEESGLVYFGRRYYDPLMGRWLSCDPLGFVDSGNLYAYVYNNPLLYGDPNGLASFRVNPELRRHYVELSKGETRMDEKSLSQVVDYASRDVSHREFQVSGRVLGRGRIGFGNGIFNSKREAELTARMLSELSGGYRVRGVYNDSRGPGALSALFESLGYKTEGVMNLRTEFCRSYLEDVGLRASGLESRYLHVSHSQGGIQMKHALRGLPVELRDYVVSLNINGGKMIPRKYCGDAMNLQSRRDFVPLLDIGGQWLHSSEITRLNPHPDAPLFDHSISSPTFRKPIEDKLTDFVNKYR